MTWIQTANGRKFDLLSPKPEDVDVYDIAHALSNICRFQGHCKWFYSVAQHSVHVAELVSTPYKLDALLHDAGEAYYGDITRPQKAIWHQATQGNYTAWLKRIDSVIAMALHLSMPMSDCVKYADDIMLATEARDLMGPPPEPWVAMPPPRLLPIVPWTPTIAFQQFVLLYEELNEW